MKAIFSLLCLLNAGASLPVNPINNIFKARAQTPIIEHAITDFQDICLTFMLHESEVPMVEDMKHFNSKIEDAGFPEQSFSNMTGVKTTYSKFQDTFYSKSDGSSHLYLRWKHPIEYFYSNSKPHKEILYKAPYGKHNGLSCSLSVKLSNEIKFSDIETEILKYDQDWIDASSEFTIFGGSHDKRIQSVNFENSDFSISIALIKPSFSNKVLGPKRPSLTFSLTRL